MFFKSKTTDQKVEGLMLRSDSLEKQKDYLPARDTLCEAYWKLVIRYHYSNPQFNILERMIALDIKAKDTAIKQINPKQIGESFLRLEMDLQEMTMRSAYHGEYVSAFSYAMQLAHLVIPESPERVKNMPADELYNTIVRVSSTFGVRNSHSSITFADEAKGVLLKVASGMDTSAWRR